jgi:hypothetical protein
MQDSEKNRKSFFKIGVIVMLITLSIIGGTPQQAKASTLSFITDPVEQVGGMYEGLGRQTFKTYKDGTASVVDSIVSFFSSIFGHTTPATTTIVVAPSTAYTPPEKKTYSTYTPPPVSTEPNKNTSSTYTKTVTNTVYVPQQISSPAQTSGITEAELEQRLAAFRQSLPQPTATTTYITYAGGGASFYGGASQSDIQTIQNSITNLQSCVTTIAAVPGNPFNQSLNTTNSPHFATVTASAFYGDGSHLTGINTFSTSTTRSIFSSTAPLTYDSVNGIFGITQASTSTNGYLSAADYITFSGKQAAITPGTTAQYYRGDKTFQTLDTSVVPENGNLYFTNARVITALTGQNITLFNNNAGYISSTTAPVTSVFGRTGAITAQSGDYTTSQVAEGTNLYFTNARVNSELLTGQNALFGNATSTNLNVLGAGMFAGNVTAASFYGDGSHLTGINTFSTSTTRSIFSSTAPLTYDSVNGIFGTASGYSIPLTASSTQWATFYNTPSSRITAGTNLCWNSNTLSVCGISAGLSNNATGTCAIALGCSSTASGSCSSAFGANNAASGGYSSAYGANNTVSCSFASAFGFCNIASGLDSSAVGYCNTASSRSSSASGYHNTASNYNSSASGYHNTASGNSSSALGYNNTACSCCSSAVGNHNTACSTNSSAFGYCNTVSGLCSSASGYHNAASGGYSSAYGANNTVSCSFASAFGFCNIASGLQSSAVGNQNTASGLQSSAVGNQNTASSRSSSASGYHNTASNYDSSAFGYLNTASGNSSSALGYNNTACSCYSSAFGLCLNNSVACSAQFGGIYGGTNAYMAIGTTGVNFCVSGTISQNGGAPSFASDRNLKENFTDVDKQSILDKINALPMQQWDYIAQGPTIKHIAPIAQDFYAAFGLNNSTTSISAIDPAGIALVGIQALSERLDALEGSTTFASMTIPYDSLTSTSSDSVWSTLQSFGADVVDGMAYLKDVMVEKMSVGSLEIKNTQDVNKTGFTIYDRATGQPICVYFENGVQETSPGDCDDDSTSTSSQQVVSQPSQNDSENQDAADASTSPQTVSASSTAATSTDTSAASSTSGDSDDNQLSTSTSASSSISSSSTQQ